MAELRKDPVLGRWVVVATERVRRPGDFESPRRPPHPGPCILCPGHEYETPPELLAYGNGSPRPGAPPWRVRVVGHKFPALRADGELERRGHGLYDVVSGAGVHEVVAESPDHGVRLADLPAEAVAEVVRAYHERSAALRHDPRLRCVAIFKTHGADGSLAPGHSYSEVLGTPVVPRAVAEELRQATDYHAYRERCLFCDILDQELAHGQRLVMASERVVAFVPFAARHPFETWLLPKRHRAAFDRSEAAERHDLARVLHDVLRRLTRLLVDPPFHLRVHSAPFADADHPAYHWHVEILPQLAVALGLAAAGLPINPLLPEDAAAFLRETSE
jgi:UDPglucose--hexose-1-phosphate uridylyltransferase